MSAGNTFVLRVPLDASQVPDFTPDRPIRVLAWNKQGAAQERLVSLNRQGKGAACFEFQLPPDALRVALGPESATPADLKHLQPISIASPASVWGASTEVTLPAIHISSYHWWWWQHWRQTFRITGRLLNPHGLPIAGATVSAFDIDAWWWWTAQEQVAGATTGADGSFSMDFARGCGWWPWWWWITRDWQVNDALVDQITGFVGRYSRFAAAMAPPATAPSLEVFHSLLASSPRPVPPAFSSRLFQAGQTIANTAIDPASLESLRERLIEILPRNFPLPVWPWSSWSPWEDCGANVIFSVTEEYAGETAVLLNETVRDARWDIPSSLDVTLTAREARHRAKTLGWNLVDYLFPADRSRTMANPVSDYGVAPPGRLA